MNRCYLFILLIILTAATASAQGNTYNLAVVIKNYTGNHIALGSLRGDQFTAIDSTDAENEVARFKILPNTTPGMYRLNFGQTTYAKVMGEAPQYLDFILNHEDVVLKTDFKNPEESLEVLDSEENKIWFDFKRKEAEFKKQINGLESLLNTAWSAGDSAKALSLADEYNKTQLERDMYITEQANINPALYASRLIKVFREPVLDGYLTQQEREKIYKKDFFGRMNFNDETLIRSAVYTDKVFLYLTSYNHPGLTKQQREEAYIKANRIVFKHVSGNIKVHWFIYYYLIHGYSILDLDKVVKDIRTNYTPEKENL